MKRVSNDPFIFIIGAIILRYLPAKEQNTQISDSLEKNILIWPPRDCFSTKSAVPSDPLEATKSVDTG